MKKELFSSKELLKNFDKKDIESLQRVFSGKLSLNETSEIILDISDSLFKKMCYKIKYLDKCEPAYCVFRINGSCHYPITVGEISDELLRIIFKTEVQSDGKKSD